MPGGEPPVTLRVRGKTVSTQLLWVSTNRLGAKVRRMNALVPTQKKRRRQSPPASTAASRVAILLEDIQGKTQLTMEAVTGVGTKIEVLRTELSQRIDILEMAVRQNGLDIRKHAEDIGQIKGDVTQLKGDVQEIRGDVTQLKVDVTQLKVDVTQFKGDVTQLKGDAQEIKGDVTQLKGDVTQIRGDVRQLRGDMSQTTEGIRGLRELLERAADREALLRLETRVQAVERRLGI